MDDLAEIGLRCGLCVLACTAVFATVTHGISRIIRRHEETGEVCLECGYCLRGLTSPRCPECGTPFDAALLRPQDKSTGGVADESGQQG